MLVFKNNVLQIKAQLLKNNQKLDEAIAAKRMVLDALELFSNTIVVKLILLKNA